MVTSLNQECECQCGKTKVIIKGKPIIRMVCHCQTCQEFNKANFGDVTLFLAKNIELSDDKSVSFKAYQSPPTVQRGKCVHCETPTIEQIKLPLGASITIIPSRLIPKGPSLPKVSGHIFYHRKVNDVNDSIPKISGFVKSQLYVGAKLVAGITRNFLPFGK